VHNAAIIVRVVDREAVARNRRRTQVAEALEEERGREEALTNQLGEVVADEDGGRIDEVAFARMDADDVALVREVLEPPPLFDEDEDDPDVFAPDDDTLAENDVEEEIERLQAEIADSRRRQLAYRRYLEALDG
jgi:hypothetical protein